MFYEKVKLELQHSYQHYSDITFNQKSRRKWTNEVKDTYKKFAGASFDVPAQSSFDLKVTELVDYCCS